MSRKVAHVNNRMDMFVMLNDKQIEHIVVHPNMVVLPQIGEIYALTTLNKRIDFEDASLDLAHDTKSGYVEDIKHQHMIVRTVQEGRHMTELVQSVTIYLKQAA